MSKFYPLLNEATREATWDQVLRVREARGCGEAEAVAEVVEVLRDAGVSVDVKMVLGCRPRSKRGLHESDGHSHDIGRAICEGGVGLGLVDGRVCVGDVEAEGVADARLEAGGAAIRAFVLRCLPAMPERKWEKRRKMITVPAGARWEAVWADGRVRRGGCWDGVEGNDFVCGWLDDGLQVRGADGVPVVVAWGAVELVLADGSRRVWANATHKSTSRNAGERMVVVGDGVRVGNRRQNRIAILEWKLGRADWDLAFRTFVTFAQLYLPESLGNLSFAATAALLGEERATISARARRLMGEYQAAGGRAGFTGLRMKVDPRKGLPGVKRKVTKRALPGSAEEWAGVLGEWRGRMAAGASGAVAAEAMGLPLDAIKYRARRVGAQGVQGDFQQIQGGQQI